MECRNCGEQKLRHEFPGEGLTAQCLHAATYCLQCVGESLGTSRTCPECETYVGTKGWKLVSEALRHLECPVFQDLDEIQKKRREAAINLVPPSGSVEVALLDGQRCTLDITRDMTLRQIKSLISQRLRVPTAQQRLMHAGKELKGDDLTWKDTKVSYDSVLQLLVVMYDTGVGSGVGGAAVRALNFDLTWIGREKRIRSGATIISHLNGSCFVLDEARRYLSSVDFRARNWRSVCHHGPSSRNSARQKVTVSFDGIGAEARYLFFTLSAFAQGGVFLNEFENPKVELRDAHTNALLADYTATRATHDEAVVLCCAKRDAISDVWRVQRIGRTSSGNVRYPHDLIQTIQNLASSDLLI